MEMAEDVEKNYIPKATRKGDERILQTLEGDRRRCRRRPSVARNRGMDVAAAAPSRLSSGNWKRREAKGNGLTNAHVSCTRCTSGPPFCEQ